MVSAPYSLQPDSETVADSREEVGSRVFGSVICRNLGAGKSDG